MQLDRKRERASEQEMTEAFHEKGLLGRGRTASWHKSCTESQKRLVVQTAEFKCQVEVEKGTKTELHDRFRRRPPTKSA